MAAKQLELNVWSYTKHLSGRAFTVVTHGDAAGPENLRRILTDWLTDMDLVPAGPSALIDTWIGWYKPYATSHDDLDEDTELFQEIENASLALVNTVTQIRTGKYRSSSEGLHDPREK